MNSLPAWFISIVASISVACGAFAKDFTIAVIPKGTTHEFWKSVHAGAVKAEQELNGKGIKTKVFGKGRYAKMIATSRFRRWRISPRAQ
jgi:ABC-type sugar transport system substrate-binding protein